MTTSQTHSLSTLALLFVLLALSAPKAPAAALTPSAAGLAVSVDEASGTDTVTVQKPAWTFSETVGEPLTDVRSTSGSDKRGDYRHLAFR